MDSAMEKLPEIEEREIERGGEEGIWEEKLTREAQMAMSGAGRVAAGEEGRRGEGGGRGGGRQGWRWPLEERRPSRGCLGGVEDCLGGKPDKVE